MDIFLGKLIKKKKNDNYVRKKKRLKLFSNMVFFQVSSKKRRQYTLDKDVRRRTDSKGVFASERKISERERGNR